MLSRETTVDMSLHITHIQRQSVFALTPKCCMLSRETTNTNFVVVNSCSLDLGIFFLLLNTIHVEANNDNESAVPFHFYLSL